MFFCGNSQSLEENILRQTHLHRNRNLDGTMRWLSATENFVAIGIPLGLCGIGYFQKKEKVFHQGVNMSLALLVNTTSTFILKRSIDRARPSQCYTFIQPYEKDTRFSFPSGHTSSAFCTATSVSLFARKWYIIVPAYLWAGGVAYSRLHLGMHHPSDILAGALLGSASAWVSYRSKHWLQKFVNKKIHCKKGE